MFAKKKPKQKTVTRPKRADITYRIMPENYVMLSEQERDAALRNFVDIIRAVEKRMTLQIINKAIGIDVAGNNYDYVDRSVYLSSKQDLGGVILNTKLRSTRLEKPLEFPIHREQANHLEMTSGGFWRAYVVHNFPRSIRPTWINELASLCSMVSVDIKLINPPAARRFLVTHANTLESRRGQRHLEEAAEARSVNDMLQNQETSIYDVGITAVVTAADQSLLKSSCKEFERSVKWRQIGCLSVAGKQAETLSGWGTRFAYPAASCAAFYPFLSSDMLEADGAGGVYLGTNELTGSPVVYDYLRRTNYNMVVLGTSGVGKSVTVKTYIDNFYRMMREKYGGDQRIITHVLDLHGEYVALADHFKWDVMDLTGHGELGLDPFRLFSSSSTAVSVLADATDMPIELRSLVISRAEGVKSVAELYDKLHEDNTSDSEECRKAAIYLAEFVSGDLAAMFTGEKGISDRTVISMRGATKNRIDLMLIALTLKRIWEEMRRLPIYVPKLLIIEEAWFLLQMPSTAAILGDIARSGRKENVHMIVMTQDIDEVLRNEHGQAVIKNAASVMLLALAKSSTEMLKSVLDLSDSECRQIMGLGKGQVIMRADRTNRIKLKVGTTPEQLEMFNTAASGLVEPGS